MKFTTSIFLFIFCIINLSYSQTDSLTLKKLYEKEVIYFSGSKYVKNNNLYPLANLKSEFKKNSEGYLEYTMYQKDNRKSKILNTVGLAGYFAGFIMTEDNPNGGAAIVILSSIPILVSIPFTVRADKRLKKAVWLRNRDVLTSLRN